MTTTAAAEATADAGENGGSRSRIFGDNDDDDDEDGDFAGRDAQFEASAIVELIVTLQDDLCVCQCRTYII